MSELEKLKEEIVELQRDLRELIDDYHNPIDEFENGWLYLVDTFGQRYRIRAQILRKSMRQEWKSERWDNIDVGPALRREDER